MCRHKSRKNETGAQRVVTLRQIDELHERSDGTARRQFNQNRKRFQEGRDFYPLDNASLNEIRSSLPAGLISDSATSAQFFTERGYGKIVKGWNDDRSRAPRGVASFHSARENSNVFNIVRNVRQTSGGSGRAKGRIFRPFARAGEQD